MEIPLTTGRLLFSLLPSGLKLLTLDEAQTIAVQNNPSFKAFFASLRAKIGKKDKEANEA